MTNAQAQTMALNALGARVTASVKPFENLPTERLTQRAGLVGNGEYDQAIGSRQINREKEGAEKDQTTTASSNDNDGTTTMTSGATEAPPALTDGSTASAGGKVVVDFAEGASPAVVDGFKSVRALAPASLAGGEPFVVVIPPQTFEPPNTSASVDLKVTTDTGQSLPTWLSFSPQTREFSGVAPAGVSQLDIKVTAQTPSGSLASTNLTLTFGR